MSRAALHGHFIGIACLVFPTPPHLFLQILWEERVLARLALRSFEGAYVTGITFLDAGNWYVEVADHLADFINPNLSQAI